jgi:hypothetical protein
MGTGTCKYLWQSRRLECIKKRERLRHGVEECGDVFILAAADTHI